MKTYFSYLDLEDLVEDNLNSAFGFGMRGFHHHPKLHYSMLTLDELNKFEISVAAAVATAKKVIKKQPKSFKCCKKVV